MSDNNSNNSQTQSIADYLAQLLKDRNKVNAFPNVFIHVERLIDEGKEKKLYSILFTRYVYVRAINSTKKYWSKTVENLR